jgi:hypothetical protein
MNSKDIANSDPAEGSREVIERELKRHENDDIESPHEPATRRDKDERKERKPH